MPPTISLALHVLPSAQLVLDPCPFPWALVWVSSLGWCCSLYTAPARPSRSRALKHRPGQNPSLALKELWTRRRAIPMTVSKYLCLCSHSSICSWGKSILAWPVVFFLGILIAGSAPLSLYFIPLSVLSSNPEFWMPRPAPAVTIQNAVPHPNNCSVLVDLTFFPPKMFFCK